MRGFCSWRQDDVHSLGTQHWLTQLPFNVCCLRGSCCLRRWFHARRVQVLRQIGNSSCLPSIVCHHLTCVPPLLEPPISRPPRVGSLDVAANILGHTVADRLEMLEHVPATQAAQLCDAARAVWAPTTVDRYSKLLAEWQRFAASCEGRWDCPPVGLVLQFADWLRESRRVAPSSIKVMFSGMAGAVRLSVN